MPGILAHIKNFIRQKRQRVKNLYGNPTIIHLVGFADYSGREGNYTEWKIKNLRLSEERARIVKRWLKKNLGNLASYVKFEAKGCGEEYYNYNDRCVEIRVF